MITARRRRGAVIMTMLLMLIQMMMMSVVDTVLLNCCVLLVLLLLSFICKHTPPTEKWQETAEAKPSEREFRTHLLETSPPEDTSGSDSNDSCCACAG